MYSVDHRRDASGHLFFCSGRKAFFGCTKYRIMRGAQIFLQNCSGKGEEMKKVQSDFTKYIMFSVAGMLGSAGTILADTYFVSNRLGAQGLTALNLAIAVFGLINGTGMMLGAGGAARYVILKTQGKNQEADQVFTTAFMAAVLAGLLFLGGGLLFSGQLATLLGADESVLPMCQVYLKTILCFAPFFVMNHFFMIFIRSDKNPRLSAAAMLTASAANIVLDFVMMYPMDLGIFGAALATGLSPVIGLCICSMHMVLKKNRFHLKRSGVSGSELRRLLSIGLSSFVNEFSASIVLIVYNLLILRCAGNTGVAAYGIVANLALVVMAVFTGISQGIQPLLGRAFGKGREEELRWLYRAGSVLCICLGAGTLILAYGCTEQLVSLFNSENDRMLQRLAENGMRMYFTGFLFAGINVVTTSLFASMQKPGIACLISVFRGCVGVIAGAVVFSAFFGMNGIWISFLVTEGIAFLIGRYFVQRGKAVGEEKKCPAHRKKCPAS